MLLSWVCKQGAGLEAEQLGLHLVPLWDADPVGGGPRLKVLAWFSPVVGKQILSESKYVIFDNDNYYCQITTKNSE